MARRVFNSVLKFNIQMSLRGDAQENGGKPTDGGYADKSFFVESRLVPTEITESQGKKLERAMKKAVAEDILRESKKMRKKK